MRGSDHPPVPRPERADCTSDPAWTVPWLVAVAAAVVVMIVLGGVVRLAHAGLSIVEWQPVAGILPPWTERAWQEAFAAYRDTPEYRLINAGMSLEAFRSIYWLEYIHRLAGRAAGLLFALPMLAGLLRRRFAPRTRNGLLGIGALFLGQGVMGWLMVASGLADQPWVSPYRLAAHLWLAFGLLAWVLWLLLDRLGKATRSTHGSVRGPAVAFLVAAIVQAGAGALVAGHRAGLVSDTFPRMQGRWIPAALGTSEPALADLLANPVTVHFEHRWFAFVVLAAALWVHARARRVAAPAALRRLAAVTALIAAAQIGLGIVVVLAGVPAPLASLHQGLGVLLFGTAVAVVHQSRVPDST